MEWIFDVLLKVISLLVKFGSFSGEMVLNMCYFIGNHLMNFMCSLIIVITITVVKLKVSTCYFCFSLL